MQMKGIPVQNRNAENPFKWPAISERLPDIQPYMIRVQAENGHQDSETEISPIPCQNFENF